MKQERNMGSRLNRHPGRPDYKVGNRKVNGQCRSFQAAFRTASLPRRARRGV